MTEEKTVPSKPAKKVDAPEPANQVPVLAFSDFVVAAGLPAVRAAGLEVYLRASTGIAPRSRPQWDEAMNHYQAQA